MDNTRVLVVEDDSNIAELLRLYLKKEGFEVDIAGDGGSGVSKFVSFKPDIVLLDIMLPVMDGWEVCRRIRGISSTPIIMLTAKSETEDKVNGLEMGADDYMTKPFAIEELLARIRVALRKSAKQKDRAAETVLSCKGVELRPDAHEVAVCGEKVELTIREFTLLQTLLEHKNIVLSRDTLIDQVWGYDYYVETNIVDVYIRYLRHKIDDRFQIHLISTVRGIGYVIKED